MSYHVVLHIYHYVDKALPIQLTDEKYLILPIEINLLQPLVNEINIVFVYKVYQHRSSLLALSCCFHPCQQRISAKILVAGNCGSMNHSPTYVLGQIVGVNLISIETKMIDNERAEAIASPGEKQFKKNLSDCYVMTGGQMSTPPLYSEKLFRKN